MAAVHACKWYNGDDVCTQTFETKEEAMTFSSNKKGSVVKSFENTSTANKWSSEPLYFNGSPQSSQNIGKKPQDGRKSPSSYGKPSVGGGKPPVEGRKSPIGGRKSPVEGRKSPIGFKKSPSFQHSGRNSGSNSPVSKVSSSSVRSSGEYSRRSPKYEKHVPTPGVRHPAVYEKGGRPNARTKSVRHYAVVFGNTTGVFNLEEYKEAIDGCDYARFRDYDTLDQASKWYESERARHLVLLSKRSFEKLENETDSQWLDRAVVHFSTTDSPLAEKSKNRRELRTKIETTEKSDEEILKYFQETRTDVEILSDMTKTAYIVKEAGKVVAVCNACSYVLKYSGVGGTEHATGRSALLSIMNA